MRDRELFVRLSVNAINSGKLNKRSVDTLQKLLNGEKPSEVELFDELLYQVHLKINNRLNPGHQTQNHLAAVSSAENGDPVSKADVNEALGRKVKYVSLEHLNAILDGKDISSIKGLSKAKTPKDYFKVITKELERPRTSLKTVSTWDKERVAQHIYHWRKKLAS